MKIAFGMIVFEGDYVLKQCLESVYLYASQILISEGPVRYWQDQGYTTSKDNTNEILNNFPDPDNKIKIIHGQFEEKDQQCREYMKYLDPDTDYIWNLDSDEVFKSKDIENIIQLLEKEQPTSVGFKSCTFYGGFDRYITGFEENRDNFLRLFKVTPGCTWQTHRPPTILYPPDQNVVKKHINSDELYERIGFKMYHYSYVFPKQVYKKINYYKAAVSRSICIDNYFYDIYLPWMLATTDKQKFQIEQKYQGVHEFVPQHRSSTYTTKFTDVHPESIQKDLSSLQNRISQELEYIKGKISHD